MRRSRPENPYASGARLCELPRTPSTRSSQNLNKAKFAFLGFSEVRIAPVSPESSRHLATKQPGPEPSPLFSLKMFSEVPALRSLLQLRYQPVPFFTLSAAPPQDPGGLRRAVGFLSLHRARMAEPPFLCSDRLVLTVSRASYARPRAFFGRERLFWPALMQHHRDATPRG